MKKGFSLKKEIKKALLSRLAIRVVSSIIAVKLNTPEDREFDPVPFILDFGGIRRQ